jgi:hypothetical protein
MIIVWVRVKCYQFCSSERNKTGAIKPGSPKKGEEKQMKMAIVE